MKLRDRIKELRRVPASELIPNPKNWRTHPTAQRDALKGVFAEVGIADACIARELPNGRLLLLDGHLRAETAPDALLPVLVLDVTEEEGDKILATLDPLSGLAGQNTAALTALLADVKTDTRGVLAMFDGLLGAKPGAGMVDQKTRRDAGTLQVIVEVRDEAAQLMLISRLESDGFTCRKG